MYTYVYICLYECVYTYIYRERMGTILCPYTVQKCALTTKGNVQGAKDDESLLCNGLRTPLKALTARCDYSKVKGGTTPRREEKCIPEWRARGRDWDSCNVSALEPEKRLYTLATCAFEVYQQMTSPSLRPVETFKARTCSAILTSPHTRLLLP